MSWDELTSNVKQGGHDLGMVDHNNEYTAILRPASNEKSTTCHQVMRIPEKNYEGDASTQICHNSGNLAEHKFMAFFVE